jgi:hypothetical protein
MRAKIKEWLKRYLPAELLSTAATIIAGIVAYNMAHSRVLMALAATWAGNIFYFGSIFLYDVVVTAKQLKQADRKYDHISFFKNIRAFIVEFGIAEVLDSFIIRPLLMYYMPIVTGSMLTGLILAKFIADITFYIPTILSYEFAKKHFRNFIL